MPNLYTFCCHDLWVKNILNKVIISHLIKLNQGNYWLNIIGQTTNFTGCISSHLVSEINLFFVHYKNIKFQTIQTSKFIHACEHYLLFKKQ